MNIYIEYKGKFYKYPDTWESIKMYASVLGKTDFAPEQQTDNPQFAPGDRVYFEDVKWKEVFTQEHGCGGCDLYHEKFECQRISCSHVGFRKLNTAESPEPETPPTTSAILDNERNQIAFTLMNTIVAQMVVLPKNEGAKNISQAAFEYADEFIARAKQEGSK